MSLENLKKEIAEFVRERDWEQYHDPKNLATGLAIEAAELLEVFLWSRTEDAERHGLERKEKVSEELADVLIYCLMLSGALKIDLLEAGFRKLEANRRKYPVALSRGRSVKYDRLGGGADS
jgi:NTP pyrophosphatase (non-canonical NTP hydrolase)